MALTDDERQLIELYDAITEACDKRDVHEGERLNWLARPLARRVYGAPVIVPQANGGRER